MLGAEVTLHYNDKLKLNFGHQIRAMKGDSIATAIKIDFLSKVDISNSAKSTRHDQVKTRKAKRNKIHSWERLDDVKIPNKNWDNVVSHASSSRNGSDPNAIDDHTTMSRQGEE